MMKTRKQEATIKSKLDKFIKPKEEIKEASYRESHNIGRRKSNDSVVTYSLNSHLFFDVYAKFDKNTVNGRNGMVTSPRSVAKKTVIHLSETTTAPRKETFCEESLCQACDRKDDESKYVRRSSRKTSEVVENLRSPLKEKLFTGANKSEKTETEISPNENLLEEKLQNRKIGRRNKSKAESSERSSEAVKLRSVISENDSTDEIQIHNVDRGVKRSRRTSLKVSLDVRATDGDLLRSPSCEDVSADKYQSYKSFPRRSRLLCEAAPVNIEGSTIPSLSLERTSPFKFPRQRRASIFKVSSPHSNDIDTFPTNTETFQRLLENKTVFKKHLSKVSLLKKSNTKAKRRESSRISKIVKQLHIESKEGESVSKENSFVVKEKSKNSLNNQSTLNRKRTKVKKAEKKPLPLREKRIASLNAAAIINCVQLLFENGRRRGSKSSGREENGEKEDIMLELETEEKVESNIKEGGSTTEYTEETEVEKEIVNKKSEKEKKSKFNRGKEKYEHIEVIVVEVQERISEEIKNEEGCKSYKEESTVKEGVKEKSVIKSSHNRFFDITKSASQRDVEKVGVPLKKVKSVILRQGSNPREINNLKEVEKRYKGIKKSKLADNEEQTVIENIKEVGAEKTSEDLTKDETLHSQLSEDTNQKKNMKNGKNGDVLKKRVKDEEKSLTCFKDIKCFKSDKKSGIKKLSSKKFIKKENIERKILPETEDNAESCWLWEGEGCEKSICLEVGREMVTRMSYPAIRHVNDDVVIKVLDCVMLRSVDDQDPYLAKIITFFYDEESRKKMMALLWYYRPEHTDQGRLMWHTEADVYASKHLDTNSIDCIEDKAFVLPIEMYSRFMSYHKRQSSSSRQGLTARLVPNFLEDTDAMYSEESQTSEVTMAMFASNLYYTPNFQTSFLPDMTTSNAFVCRGFYDIQQHKITRNIIQLIQSPIREPELERCPSVDSAMSISSCNSESRLMDHHSLFDIPLPPNIEDMSQQSLSLIDSTAHPLSSLFHLPPKSCSIPSLPKSRVFLINQPLSTLNGDVFPSVTNGL